MRRLQFVLAVLLLVGSVAGAAYADREIGPRSLAPIGGSERVPSGAWFCPHGGGEQGWEVSLQIANPGPATATVRIRELGGSKPQPAVTETVEPGSMAVVPVDAAGRERTSMVEWFGQWVAVGWVSHAGGDEGGVAAEPCSAASGERWLLPDGSTASKDEDDYVVVMNPTAREAIVSFTLLSERKAPVQKSELTDVVLKPFRSMIVRLSSKLLGEDTVGTVVEAAAGRVVAATLGISATGGIRSSLGYLGDPPSVVVFPGGEDAGRTQLAVMSTGTERVTLSADLIGTESEQPFPGLADAAPPARSARSFTTTTAEPSSVVFSTQDPGVAAVRRTFGSVSDQGSTVGEAPSDAWIVLPAVFGSPAHPGIALANAGDATAEISLWPLGAPEEAVTLTIPPRSSVMAPQELVDAHEDAAFVAIASSGSFAPAAASYSRGRQGLATFAVAAGIAVPAGLLAP